MSADAVHVAEQPPRRQEQAVGEVVRLDAGQPSAVRSCANELTVSGLGSRVLHEPSYTDQARAAGRCTAGSGSVSRRR